MDAAVGSCTHNSVASLAETSTKNIVQTSCPLLSLPATHTMDLERLGLMATSLVQDKNNRNMCMTAPRSTSQVFA